MQSQSVQETRAEVENSGAERDEARVKALLSKRILRHATECISEISGINEAKLGGFSFKQLRELDRRLTSLVVEFDVLREEQQSGSRHETTRM
jgi:hypothetical protein